MLPEIPAALWQVDAYDRGVAPEYAHVPPELYALGRRAFLAGLVARPRIFLSDFFHARLDAAARANLARARLVIRSLHRESHATPLRRARHAVSALRR